MKTLTVVAAALFVASANLTPVFAEPSQQLNQSAVIEKSNVEHKGMRLFHSRRHVALKQVAETSSAAEPVEPGASLDYAPEEFIIN